MPVPLEVLRAIIGQGRPPQFDPPINPLRTYSGLTGELGTLTRPGGGVSTEISITVTDPRLNGGKATNIPTLVTGQIGIGDLLLGKPVTLQQEDIAIRRAIERQANGEFIPSYNSVEEAGKAAAERSKAANQAMQTTSQKELKLPSLSPPPIRYPTAPSGQSGSIPLRNSAASPGPSLAEMFKALPGPRGAVPSTPMPTWPLKPWEHGIAPQQPPEHEIIDDMLRRFEMLYFGEPGTEDNPRIRDVPGDLKEEFREKHYDFLTG